MSTKRNYAHEVVTDTMHNQVPNLSVAQRARDRAEHLQEVNDALVAALEQATIALDTVLRQRPLHNATEIFAESRTALALAKQED